MLASLEDSELLSLLSESESEESDPEEDSEDEDVRTGFFCSASGFWATMTLGVFFQMFLKFIRQSSETYGSEEVDGKPGVAWVVSG